MVYFCLGIIWKVILKKEVKIGHTKIVKAGLDFSRQDFSLCGLRFVVALSVRCQIDFSYESTGGVQSSCKRLWEGVMFSGYVEQGGVQR